MEAAVSYLEEKASTYARVAGVSHRSGEFAVGPTQETAYGREQLEAHTSHPNSNPNGLLGALIAPWRER